MTVANHTIWNDAERERVAAMLIAGWSRGRIAAAMGIERNAALGRIYRDEKLRGLGPKQPTKWFKEAPIAKEKRPPPRPPIKHQPPQPQRRQAIPKPPKPHVPPFRRLALFELADRNECCFPVDEDSKVPGKHLFCAAPTTSDSRWCPYHEWLGYTSGRAQHGSK